MVYNPKSTNLKKQNMVMKKKVILITASISGASLTGHRLSEVLKHTVFNESMLIQRSSVESALRDMKLNDIACVIFENEWLLENATALNFLKESIEKVSREGVQIVCMLVRNIFVLNDKDMSENEKSLRLRLLPFKNKPNLIIFNSYPDAYSILTQYFASHMKREVLEQEYSMQSIH